MYSAPINNLDVAILKKIFKLLQKSKIDTR